MDNRVLILRDDKNVSVNNVYKTIQVVDNNRPVSPINVIQEVTNIIQVTTGIPGHRGEQGPSGSQGLSSTLTASYVGYGAQNNSLSGSSNFVFTGSNLIISSTGRYLRLGGWSTLDTIYSALYFGIPTPQNFSLAGDGTNTFLNAENGSGTIFFQHHNTSIFESRANRINFIQPIYFGDLNITPTAKFHIGPSNGNFNTAPIKFTSGSLLTLVEQGAVETSGSHLYYSPSNILRNTFAQIYSGSSNTNEIPYFDSNGFLTRSENLTFLNSSNNIYGNFGGVLVGSFTPGQNFIQGLYSRLTIYSAGSACRIDLLNDGNLNFIGNLNFTGSISAQILQGTGSRMIEADATGSLSAQSQIIQAYLTNYTIISNLITGSSWSTGSYIGPVFTGSYQGQFYNSGSYFYFAVADDLFIRMQLV
jgi:hypothetical protein